jgi:acetylornithine deacetylase
MSREAAELVHALVGLDSTNPQLVPGGAGEGPVAEFLLRRLEAAGLELDVWDVLPGRPNVVATLRGTSGGKRLMSCAAATSSSGPSCATAGCTAAAPST